MPAQQDVDGVPRWRGVISPRQSELPLNNVENQDLARQHYADKDMMLTMQKLDLAIANDINYQYLAQRQYVDRDPVVLRIATNVTVSLSAR